jgi:hypothetical protein
MNPAIARALLARFIMKRLAPNPSFHRTLRIKPRKAGEFKR